MGTSRTAVLRGALGVGAAVLAMGLLMAWLAGAFRDRIPPPEPARGDAPAARAGADLDVVAVRRVEVPNIREAVGSIAAEHEIAVTSLIRSRVVEVAASPGQLVEAGAVLVRLDDSEAKARLAQARAERARAADTLSRIERLHKGGAASDEQLAQAQLAVEAASAQVDEAEVLLGYTVAKAPVRGIVIERFCEVGDGIMPGQLLVRMYDRLQFVARVPEALTGHLAIGQEVEVYIDALGGSCAGTVREIVPRAETAARAFQVKVSGPCHEGVIPGLFGRMRIPLGEVEELRMPRSAVRAIGQVQLAFVRDEAGALARRFVRLGGVRIDDDEVVVVSGLAAGELVVRDASRVGVAEAAR